jgi:hypothetical protein
VTGFVVTGNVAVVAFAATVTDTGTVAAFRLLLVSTISAPPAGAAVVSVSVPVLATPPTTAVGFNVSAASVATGGLTVRVAVFANPL